MDSSRWNKTVRRVFGSDARIEFARFFESKKNQVTLLHLDIDGVPRQVVAKYFVWGDCSREWNVINRACDLGVPVPRPLGRSGHIIFTEMIPGENGRLVCSRNPEELDFTALGRWLGLFHRAFDRGDGVTMQKGDLMLPNFIFPPGKDLPVGVDFEEARLGDVREDLSHIMTTALCAGEPGALLAETRFSAFLEGYRSESPFAVNIAGLTDPVAERLRERAEYMPHLKDYFLQVRSGIMAKGLPGMNTA